MWLLTTALDKPPELVSVPEALLEPSVPEVRRPKRFLRYSSGSELESVSGSELESVSESGSEAVLQSVSESGSESGYDPGYESGSGSGAEPGSEPGELWSEPESGSVSDSCPEPGSASQAPKPKVQYAILSHCWEEAKEEITFAEMRSRRYSKKKKGYFKLDKARQQARLDGYAYVWIDTCCIDKRSSAELQEAINSMYHWYERAAVCYAYLNDVKFSTVTGSRWFTRGWTLQELIAPRGLKFYDKEWKYLGTKRQFCDHIAKATTIPQDVLSGKTHHRECSVAQRMSWASRRTTSRIEDVAYSLLGLFDVSMPLLYGERTRAFARLQEEIMKSSDDQTIFVWQGPSLEHSTSASAMPGMLATGPADFKTSGTVQRTTLLSDMKGFRMTNRGLSITISLQPWVADTYVAMLDVIRLQDPRDISPDEDRLSKKGCWSNERCFVHERCWDHYEGSLVHENCLVGYDRPSKPSEVVGLFLRRLRDDDTYARVAVDGQQLFSLESASWSASSWFDSPNLRRRVTIDVLQAAVPSSEQVLLQERVSGFRLSGTLFLNSSGNRNFELGHPEVFWSADERIVSRKSNLTEPMLEIPLRVQNVTLKLSFDKHFNPVVFICERSVPDGQPAFDLWTGKVDVKILRDNATNDAPSIAWSARNDMDDGVVWHERAYFACEGTKVYRNKHHPYLWLLKGHRTKGLDVYLSHGPHADLLSEYGFHFELLQHIQLTRQEVSGKLIWALTADATPRTSGTTEDIDHLLPKSLITSARLQNGRPASSTTVKHMNPAHARSSYGFYTAQAYELPG